MSTTNRITVTTPTQPTVTVNDSGGVDINVAFQNSTGGGGSGDVVGPSSSTDNAIARYDGTTGKLIQDSGITIADGASGTLSGTNSGDVTLGTANGLSLAGQALSLAAASGSTTGALTSADWTTFNAKQSALTLGNLTSPTTGVSVTGGTGAVVGSGAAVTIQTASGSQPGLLSAADWTTFNSKQAAGSYITALTGDVTASGPGSVTATLANTAVTPGLYTLANVRVDEKGRVTEATDGSVAAAAVSLDTSSFEVITGFDVQAGFASADVALLNARATGIQYGGELTSLGAGVVRIASGRGSVLDSTNPSAPTYTEVDWVQTDIDLSASSGLNYIYVNAAGTVASTTTAPSHAEYRESIWLHRVNIVSGLYSASTPIPMPTQQLPAQLWDVWDALGAMKEGLALSPASTNLTLAIAAGSLYRAGSNYYVDPQSPNQVSFSTRSPVTFRMVVRTGTSGADVTALDVGNYDNAGVVTAISGASNRATIFTVKQFPGPLGNVRIFYGQTVYNTITEAQTALGNGTYSPTFPSSYDTAITLGWVIAQKGATNLADGTQILITSNKFGLSGGGAANTGGTPLYVSDLGAGVQTALAVNVGSAGALVTNGGALGTPSSGTLTSCTGLPISTGVSGLGTNVAASLANAMSASGTLAILGANTFTALQQFSGTDHAGLRLNNLTTAQRDALASPAAGMVIWNTTAARLQLHNGSAWTAGMVRLDGDTMTGTLTVTPAANTSGLVVSGYSLTGSSTTALLNLSGTWNTTGIAEGLFLNITNTASNAASRLLRLQASGVDRFAVAPTGGVTLRHSASANDFISIGGTSNMIMTAQSNAVGIHYQIVGDDGGGAPSFRLTSGGTIEWNSTTTLTTGSRDLFIRRGAAGLLSQHNSTNAQAFRVANTFTSATNFEAFTVDWQTTSNVCRVGTIKGSGGGTARALSLITDATVRAVFEATTYNTTLLAAAGSYGSGSGVLFLGNATTAPTTDPTGGGILYVEAGALKYRGSSGTVTTIANA